MKAWVDRVTWVQAKRTAGLEDGDLVRLLKRVVDVLGQIKNAPALHRKPRQAAKSAITAIDRPPVLSTGEDLSETVLNGQGQKR